MSSCPQNGNPQRSRYLIFSNIFMNNFLFTAFCCLILSPHAWMTKCCISNFIVVQLFICITTMWWDILFSYDQISIFEIYMCLVDETLLEFHRFKHLLQALMKPYGFHLHLLAPANHPQYNLSCRVSHHPGHRDSSLLPVT